MREILFRGKRMDNGEWVYGDLMHKHYNFDTKATKVIHNNVMKYKVIPETIGQHTGLTDKNGKRIFEGDILAFTDRLTRVEWHDYCGCWDCIYIKSVNGYSTKADKRVPSKWKHNGEIIGNIHDNPELLKGGA